MNDLQHSSRVWRSVATAVDYLSVTSRPGLTVWDALEEAVRWWTIEWTSPGSDPSAVMPWNDPDPLRSSLDQLLGTVASMTLPDGHSLPAVLDTALDAWLVVMSDRCNGGVAFDVDARTVGFDLTSWVDIS